MKAADTKLIAGVPLAGFNHKARGGIMWPRGIQAARETVIVDTEEDPPGRQFEGKFAIGQRTLRAVEADAEMMVNGVGSSASEDRIAELEKAAAKIEDENKALRARIAELEKAAADTKGKSKT